MNNQSKNAKINTFFSAFLIIAYVICSYFFADFAMGITSQVVRSLVFILIFVIFGLLVFYATRVGEGKPVKRFSLVTLLVLDIPALYIVVASVAKGLPFHDQIADNTVILFLAAIALGYGIPYTFLSGFELVPEEGYQVFEETIEVTVSDDETEENIEDDEANLYEESKEEDEEILAEQDSLDEKE